MSVRFEGQLWDIESPTRCFQKYSVNERANKMASHRQGFRQRQAVGEFFYVHPLIPNRAFDTRGDAIRAALRTLSHLREREERK